MQPDPKFWVAYPKLTSKIASDLNRDCNWDQISDLGFEVVSEIAIDNVWTAVRFKKISKSSDKKAAFAVAGIDLNARTVNVPEELKLLFKKNRSAQVFFESLPVTNRREYVDWVIGAKRSETKIKRLDAVVEKLSTGKKNPGAR